MKIRIYKIGKPAFSESKAWVDRYQKRLRNQIEVHVVTSKSKQRDPLAFLHSMPSHEHKLFVLDERGLQMTSTDLATELNDLSSEGSAKSASFVIGGPYGVDPEVYQAAHKAWCLSKGTLPSDLAWLVATEQIYRALNIIQGSPYHHAEVPI